MLFPPCLEDFRKTGASFVSGANHLKHLLQRRVATIALTAGANLFYGQSKQTGIVKLEAVVQAKDANPATRQVISMYQGIDHCLAQGFVLRRLVASEKIGPHEKGNTQTVTQFYDHLAIEIKQVAWPGTVKRYPVEPTWTPCSSRSGMMSVVELKMGQPIENGTLATKHQ